MNITNKLLLLVSTIILLTLFGNYYFHKTQIQPHLKESQLEWVETLTHLVSEGVAKDTINGNKIHVHELLKRIVIDESIEYVYVTDMNGQLFAHTFDKGFPRFLLENISKHSKYIGKSHFDARYNTKHGEIIEFDVALVEGLSARIYLGVNQAEVDSLMEKVTRSLFWFIGLLGLISFIIAVIIARRISLPLTSFAQKLLVFSNDSKKEFPEITTTDPDINNLVNMFKKVIEEQKNIDITLTKTQQSLLLHHQLSPIGIIEWSTDFRFVDVNPAVEKMFGYSKEELLGRHITENILPESAREQVDKVWAELMTHAGGGHSINKNITKDGKIITCEWNNTALVDDNGEVISIASYVEDITLSQQQEEQIRRSQKMDALGKLTGGISHDYNNMLGVILGYAELLQMNLQEQPELLNYANEILHAGDRGAKLTKRLLAFSTQKSAEASDINLNNVLLDEKDMLEKTLTVRVKLVLDLAEDVKPIYVDVNDLEDMILNVSINAMHAMEQGGQLTFTTRNELLSFDNAQVIGLEAGDYVVLSITDTGQGMDKETINHIFEPFYSTKGANGTGLGLSQVYGFMQRSDGVVKVYSEPEEGTRFSFYFPCYHGSSDTVTEIRDGEDDSLLRGNESLLVVDDEKSLRKLMQNILEARGYKVFVAEDGKQALKILEMETVDAVISDIIMPEMDGYQLAEKILQHYPKIKIQLVSGFNDTRHQDKVDDELQQNLLHKPINNMVLLKRIRDLLDSK